MVKLAHGLHGCYATRIFTDFFLSVLKLTIYASLNSQILPLILFQSKFLKFNRLMLVKFINECFDLTVGDLLNDVHP